MKTLALAFALAVVLAAPGLAFADASADLATLREHILFARYDEAEVAARAMMRRDDLNARERVLALECLAIVLIANDKNDEAAETLVELYRRDPGHVLSDVDASPRVQSAFARTREAQLEPVAVRLEHTTPELAQRETPVITIRVLEGQNAIQELRLGYRFPGETTYTQVLAPLEGAVARMRIPLPPRSEVAENVAYVIDALAPSGARLAAVGNDAAPLELIVPPPSAEGTTRETSRRPLSPLGGDAPSDEVDGGVASKWWFWTAIVVGAGAIATGVALAVSMSERPEDPMGSLGTITLQ
jgi:hypothetical protein